MISGHGDMDSVIAAMRQGALDFFPKPFGLSDIRIAIERTGKFLALQHELSSVQNTCNELICKLGSDFEYPIIGASASIKNILNLMEQVSSATFTDVLITGESGTGKELVARGIHCLSQNRTKPFFAINCTAIPENLFESEFFGHTRNAFTGAQTEKKGWLEIASGGTLFLDEIGDMPLAMQAKLLRVLEERKFRKVGSNTELDLKVRVIASTNQDIAQKIGLKQFRDDLFYRLNRFAIQIPPLRNRPEDIPLLADHINRVLASTLKKPLRPIAEDVILKMQQYPFPGNVRELRNMIEKALILQTPQEHILSLASFPELLKLHPKPQPAMAPTSLDLTQLEDLESQLIHQAMQQANYNKSKAAELLNISRSGLNRRLEKLKQFLS